MVRRGRRVGRSRLVVHVLPPGARAKQTADTQRHGPLADQHGPTPEVDSTPTWEQSIPPQVGFVVSKAVGNAVVRHRVTRRLRHVMRARIERFPAGTLVVVRALPPAAASSSRELGVDIDAALRKLRVFVPTDEHGSTGST